MEEEGESVEPSHPGPEPSTHSSTSPMRTGADTNEQKPPKITNQAEDPSNDAEMTLEEILSKMKDTGLTVSRFQYSEMKKEINALTTTLKEKAIEHMLQALNVHNNENEKSSGSSQHSRILGTTRPLLATDSFTSNATTVASGNIETAANSHKAVKIAEMEVEVKKLERQTKVLDRHLREHQRDQKHIADKIHDLELKIIRSNEGQIVRDMLDRVPTGEDMRNIDIMHSAMKERQTALRQIKILNMQYHALDKVIHPSYSMNGIRKIMKIEDPQPRQYSSHLPDFTKMTIEEQEELFRNNNVEVTSDDDFHEENKKLKLGAIKKSRLRSKKENALSKVDDSDEDVLSDGKSRGKKLFVGKLVKGKKVDKQEEDSNYDNIQKQVRDDRSQVQQNPRDGVGAVESAHSDVDNVLNTLLNPVGSHSEPKTELGTVGEQVNEPEASVANSNESPSQSLENASTRGENVEPAVLERELKIESVDQVQSDVKTVERRISGETADNHNRTTEQETIQPMASSSGANTVENHIEEINLANNASSPNNPNNNEHRLNDAVHDDANEREATLEQPNQHSASDPQLLVNATDPSQKLSDSSEENSQN